MLGGFGEAPAPEPSWLSCGQYSSFVGLENGAPPPGRLLDPAVCPGGAGVVGLRWMGVVQGEVGSPYPPNHPEAGGGLELEVVLCSGAAV